MLVKNGGPFLVKTDSLLLRAPEGREMDPLSKCEGGERCGVTPANNRPDDLGR
jgi:hypothetical protein